MSEFSLVRRLFIGDDVLRRNQALFTWQHQVLESPEYEKCKYTLKFLIDPFEETIGEFNSS